MEEIVWINGKVVKKKEAKVSIFDHAYLYGDGLFETMRAYKGKVFRLDQHTRRLLTSSKILKIKIPYSVTFLKNIISKLTKKIKSESAYVRIAVTRGVGRIGLDPALCRKPNVILYLYSFRGYPASFYERGAEVIISSIRRNNYSPLSNIKSNNYQNNILALMEAKEKGKDDAIMLNVDGFVSEATTSNIFIVKGKKLITPKISEGILPGITRAAIIEIAPELGLKVLQRRISISELKKAEETFLTNSIAEVRGVVGVNSVKIGGGKVGPVTRLLHRLYQQLVKKELKIQ